MSKFDIKKIRAIEKTLLYINEEILHLPGIENEANREVFIKQIIESIRRIEYLHVVKERSLSSRSKDPHDPMFDPLKAAIIHMREENWDEAFWMVFLFVHFGKNARAGWRYAREVYGRLGKDPIWDWSNIVTNVDEFKFWLHSHQSKLKRKGVYRGFGNHRKYQSLDAYSKTGTGSAIESYIKWVRPPRTHRELMEYYCENERVSSTVAFDRLYCSMESIVSFGRTARFDYLTLVGNIGLANIKPGLAYIKDSTGPKIGAQLLLTGERSNSLGAKYLEECLEILDSYLEVGKQVLEDSLCNWQKHPDRFVPFRG